MMREIVKPKRSFAAKLASGMDSIVGFFNPRAGLERRSARMAADIMAGPGQGYRGARKDRTTNNWLPSAGSADEDIYWDLPTMRERSRDLARNDPHAAGILETMSSNVIGTGIRPQSRIDPEMLGISGDEAVAHDAMAERVYRSWLPHADAHGRMDFNEMQALIDKQILINGEMLVIERQIRSPQRPFLLAYEMVETDRIDTPPSLSSDLKVRNGVRIGENDEPVGIYIRKIHPGEMKFRDPAKSQEFVYIPLYNSAGRRNYYHLYWMDRPGQNRGVPFFAPALEYFQHKHKYIEAETIAARVAACFTVFVKRQEAYGAITARTGEKESDGRRIENVAPGMIGYLNPGEDITFANPARPVGNFEAFVNTLLRAIGASLGLPYELVAKDFSQVNYSSARAALLEARRYFEKRQDWLKRKYLQPVWCNLQEEAFLSGYFGDINFYEQKEEWTKSRWISPGWKWVDPVKEAESSKLAMDSGLSTGSDEAAGQGRDWFENVEQLAREAAHVEKVSKKYGVSLFEPKAAQTAPPKVKPEEDPNEKQDQ